LSIINKKWTINIIIVKRKKKEKIVGNSLPLNYGHHTQLKDLVELVSTQLQKDAGRHRKKLHGSLKQCPVKHYQKNW
jgi:hypothetical protein